VTDPRPEAATDVDEWSHPHAALPDTTASSAVDGDDPASAPAESGEGSRSWRSILEWAIVAVVAVGLAVAIRAFLFQTFYIPSGSMEPTLKIGDRVLVNKLSYDLHDLHRGDIVVFQSGPNPAWHRAGIDDLVKRVIALPGETVTQCDGKNVCIDGKRLVESYLPKGTVTDITSANLPKLQDGTLVCAPDSPPDGCKVPKGEVFVMGDNRGDSLDSRENGPIKESSIVGRVFLRIWPLGRIGFM
jgi:signal peptidase I